MRSQWGIRVFWLPTSSSLLKALDLCLLLLSPLRLQQARSIHMLRLGIPNLGRGWLKPTSMGYQLTVRC